MTDGVGLMAPEMVVSIFFQEKEKAVELPEDDVDGGRRRKIGDDAPMLLLLCSNPLSSTFATIKDSSLTTELMAEWSLQKLPC